MSIIISFTKEKEKFPSKSFTISVRIHVFQSKKKSLFLYLVLHHQEDVINIKKINDIVVDHQIIEKKIKNDDHPHHHRMKNILIQITTNIHYQQKIQIIIFIINHHQNIRMEFLHLIKN